MNPSPSEGWFLDPEDSERWRFHDGKSWTSTVQSRSSAKRPPTHSGWYPDPLQPDRQRYFDAPDWTDEVRSVATPPLDSVAPDSAATTHQVLVSGSSSPREIVAEHGSTLPQPSGATPPTDNGRSSEIRQVLDSAAPAPAAAPPRPAWMWMAIAGSVVLVLMLGAIVFASQQAPAPISIVRPASEVPPDMSGSGDTSSDPNTGSPDSPSQGISLTDDDVASALQRAYEDFSIQPNSVDPASIAASAWLAESTDPAAVASGNFAVVLLYQDLWDSRGTVEEAYLDELVSNLEFYYPYQVWTRNRCANAVVIVADIAFTWLEAELPPEVRCEPF